MGIFDRIGKMIGASYDAAKAPIGFVSDIATAPWRDDEVDGVVGTITNTFGKRFGEVIDGSVGEDSFLGYGFREANEHALEPLMDGLDAAYREIVSRPLSTAFTVGSLTEAPGGGGFAGIFSGENWREGYRQSKFTSPGQALVLAGMTKDITDPEEQRRAAATDEFKVISGTVDALSRVFLDPTIVGGKIAKVYKGGRWITEAGTGKRVFASKEIMNVEQRNRYLASDAYQGFKGATFGKSAVEIRDAYFKKDIFGSQISTAIAGAKTEDEHRLVVEALMGGSEAKAILAKRNVALANQLDRALGREQYILNRKGTLFEYDGDVDEVNRLRGEIDSLYNTQDEMEAGLQAASGDGALLTRMPESLDDQRLTQLATNATKAVVNSGVVQKNYAGIALAKGAALALPDNPRFGKIHGFLGSDYIQKNALGVVIRKGTTWKPGGSAGVVSLHDPNSEREFSRFLQKSGLDEQQVFDLRERYMRAVSETDRSTLWGSAETLAIKSIAEKEGLSVDEVEDLVAEARKGRDGINKLVNGKGRVYDGEGRSRIQFRDPDSGHVVDIPLLNSQNENVHFVRDLDEIRGALSKMGKFKSDHPNIEKITGAGNAFFEGYQRYWKAGTLLRLGWPQRVIADEQMRIMAKIGVLANAKNLGHAVGQGIVRSLRKVDDELRVPGYAEWKYGDLQMPAAFGGMPGDAKNVFVGLNLARGEADKLYGLGHRKYLEELYGEKLVGDFKVNQHTVYNAASDPAQHAAAWLHDVNNQLGGDALARQFLQNKSVDEAVDWMRNTAEGRKYMSRNSIRRRNPRKWAADVEDQVRRYTMNDDTIKAAALGRKVTVKDLERVAPDFDERPLVQGAILEDALGKGKAIKLLDDIVQNGYKNLGERPSAFLSRNPFFDYVYRNQMKRMVDLHDGPTLQQADLERMADVARQRALGETRNLLYDMAEESDLEGMLKFFMPFYGAWQEVITRWAGLAVENPVFVARIRQVWNSPEKAGIVTDEKGNQVFEDGSALTPDGIPTTAGKDRFINMPFLPGMEKLPFIGNAIEGKDHVQFNKKSLNLALSAPGFGPLVQVPINEVAKRRPELEASVKFFLPFGATQESWQMLIPTNFKNMYQAQAGEEDRKFRNQAFRIYWDKMTDYNLGKRETEPTWEEAEDEASKLAHLRLFSSYTMPFSATYVSPYQPYIDALRGARERLAEWQKLPDDVKAATPPPLGGTAADPVSPDDWFYDTYGPEYFALTMSLSKSMDGVPPTLEGYRARGRYKDLIEKYPEFGSLIVGEEGAGEFMSSVYAAQLQNTVKPGSDMPQRDAPSFEESQASYQAKQGWIEYTRFMDLLEAERINRGLPSLNVKAASDLQDMKRQLVGQLSVKYEGWRDDYGKSDLNATEDRIKALSEIAADPRMQKREEIRRLNDYLDFRQKMVNELGARKASGDGSTLQSNPDLQQLWDETVGEMVESHLGFAQLYYRFLDRDQLLAPKEVQAGTARAAKFGTRSGGGNSERFGSR